MPDWFYHIFYKPLLFRFPAKIARDISMAAIGIFCSQPFVRTLIDLVCQMGVAPQLRRPIFGIEFNSPIGLGVGLDVHNWGLNALSTFGFGFVEIGPVTMEPYKPTKTMRLQTKEKAIEFPDGPENDGCAATKKKLERRRDFDFKIGVRLAHAEPIDLEQAVLEVAQLLQEIARYADYLILDTRWGPASAGAEPLARTAYFMFVADFIRGHSIQCPLFVSISPDLSNDQATQIIEAAADCGIKGILVAGGESHEGTRLTGGPTYTRSIELISFLRLRWPMLTIIGSGGVLEPQQALEMLRAGVDLVQINSGFVFAGPGLPKRINEAVTAYRLVPMMHEESKSQKRLIGPGWLWLLIMGAALAIGGCVAWFVASTIVILPVDEKFLRMSRSGIMHLNDKLLPFISQDRVVHAATSVSLGIMYAQLAFFWVRRGYDWAYRTIAVSAIAGFLSFVLFVNFKYFDSLPAAFYAGLLLCLLFGLPNRFVNAPRSWNLRNDLAWQLSLAGQVCFVILGIGFIVAAINVARLGTTAVFVPEDLLYLHTTAKSIASSNAHLIPLIAHSRAALGGILLPQGIAVLLTSLWGYREGERWLWCTFAAAGLPVFVAALQVYHSIDYLSPWLLARVVVAFVIYAVGLLCSFQFFFKSRRTDGLT